MMTRPTKAPASRPPSRMRRARRKGALASLRSCTSVCSEMPPFSSSSASSHSRRSRRRARSASCGQTEPSAHPARPATRAGAPGRLPMDGQNRQAGAPCRRHADRQNRQAGAPCRRHADRQNRQAGLRPVDGWKPGSAQKLPPGQRPVGRTQPASSTPPGQRPVGRAQPASSMPCPAAFALPAQPGAGSRTVPRLQLPESGRGKGYHESSRRVDFRAYGISCSRGRTLPLPAPVLNLLPPPTHSGDDELLLTSRATCSLRS
jgi:hypothetical protein